MFLKPPIFILVFCYMFKKILTKPQLKNLGLFLTQRMICSPKHHTISFIQKLFLKSPSINALSNFLNTSTDIWDKLKEKRKQIIVSKFKSLKGALILDDTFCYKTGKKMGQIYMNFCHVLKKKVLSHVVVTSVYKTPKLSIGYDFKTYIPKEIASSFLSKYDIALEMIKDAYQRGLIKRVYFDSWFCQPCLLKKIKPMNLEFFGMFRIGKMKIKSKNKYYLLSDYVKRIIEDNNLIYRNLKGRKKTYKIRYFCEIVFIKHLGKIKIVISQKYDQKNKIYNEPRVYCSNVLSFNALEIIRTYLNRWDIEVFHKAVKQSYGFEDYQVIEAEARDAYFELAFLSDMLLHLKRFGHLMLHGANAYVLRHVQTEKVGSEDLVLNALAAQKKGNLKEFIQMYGFDEKRFEYFI